MGFASKGKERGRGRITLCSPCCMRTADPPAGHYLAVLSFTDNAGTSSMQDGARDESIKDLAQIGSRKEGKSLYHVRIQDTLSSTGIVRLHRRDKTNGNWPAYHRVGGQKRGRVKARRTNSCPKRSCIPYLTYLSTLGPCQDTGPSISTSPSRLAGPYQQPSWHRAENNFCTTYTEGNVGNGSRQPQP